MLRKLSLLVGSFAALVCVGCARAPADDWHQFTIEVVPAMEQVHTATAGWGKINSLTEGATSSAAAYDNILQILTDEIVPALEKAARLLESAEPDTDEVRAARDQYAAGVRQTRDGALEMQKAIANIRRGNTRDGEAQLQRAQPYMEQGRATMKEAGRSAEALNQKYGRAVIN